MSSTAKKWLIIAAVVVVLIVLVCLYFAFVPVWCTIQVVLALIIGGIAGWALDRLWIKWAGKGTE